MLVSNVSTINQARDTIEAGRALAAELRYINTEALIRLKLNRLDIGNASVPSGKTLLGNDFHSTKTAASCSPIDTNIHTETSGLSVRLSVPCSGDRYGEDGPMRASVEVDGSNINTADPIAADITKDTAKEPSFDIRRRCDISVRELLLESSKLRGDNVSDLITIAEFKRDFVDTNQPVVLKGLLNNGGGVCSYDYLI
jgi:hypothetical protein